MIKDYEKLIEAITKEIKERTDIAVVGMSGGADSTLVAVLCTLALGKNEVISVHMPYNKTDSATFNDRSLRCALKLGVGVVHAPINDIADHISNAVAQAFSLTVPSELSVQNQGNSRSRARMNVLYGICHHLGSSSGKRARVIGTGNLSEDYIGYDTKGGDALCDFFPIGELFKSEVYAFLEYFKAKGLIDETMIDRVPSAGLWEGQTDEGELGISYNEMEPSIRSLLAANEAMTDIDKRVKQMHETNKHKHEAPPAFKIRYEFCD